MNTDRRDLRTSVFIGGQKRVEAIPMTPTQKHLSRIVAVIFGLTFVFLLSMTQLKPAILRVIERPAQITGAREVPPDPEQEKLLHALAHEMETQFAYRKVGRGLPRGCSFKCWYPVPDCKQFTGTRR